MKISIITPTYNEKDNIEKLCNEIKGEMSKINLDYEHIIIDNNSTDGTIEKIKDLAKSDKKPKNYYKFKKLRSYKISILWIITKYW